MELLQNSESAPNPALNLASFSRWTLRDKTAQRRSALRLAIMKPLVRFATFLLCFAPVIASADDFFIEDPLLKPLPTAVDTAIRSGKGFELGSCKLIGKAVDLTGSGPATGYVATTADACGWGAALGPIWVVQGGANPATVLDHGGYSLTLGKQTQNGFRNIAISAGTAGGYLETLWKFDGVRYAKTKEKNR
jgi:hypothetical protein